MTAAVAPHAQFETIRALGFSERDAAFLAAVVCAGGYFLRRQYAEALGIGRGRADAEFVRRLAARKLAMVHTFCEATQVVHLTSKSFWDEEPATSTRVRRTRSPLQIKPRLMALDTILACPEIRFASGQRERLLLCQQLGIDLAAVPSRQYCPHQIGRPVTRYLPDAHLVGVTTAEDATPAVVCGFVDPGAATRDGFHTFLRRHEGMFGVARAWIALYVCQSARQAASAQRLLEETFQRESAARAQRQRQELMQYLRLRRLYEAERWSELDTVSIKRYFTLKAGLGPAAEHLFQRWQREGDTAFNTLSSAGPSAARGRFKALVLTHSYAAVEPSRGFL